VSTHVRRLFWTEALLGAICGVLAVLTAVWPDWIEVLTEMDPDHGNGSLELAITLGFAVASIGLVIIARRELRRHRAATM
jgi:hypothetical protein